MTGSSSPAPQSQTGSINDLSSQHFLMPTSAGPAMPSSTVGRAWDGTQESVADGSIALSSMANATYEEEQQHAIKPDLKKLIRALTTTKTTDSTALAVEKSFLDFLLRFEDKGVHVYEEKIKLLRDEGRLTVIVDFGHLLNFDEQLARSIAEEFARFEPHLKHSLAMAVEQVCPQYLMLHNNVRNFTVGFTGLAQELSVRDLRSYQIGQMLKIKGTVTRTSVVRPELVYGTFQCKQCKQVYPNIEQQNVYTTPVQCMNPLCNNADAWDLMVERSKFVDWQKIRIQENANEIPPGSMPRSIDVIVRQEMCEVAKPGDKCVFTGMPVALPDVSQLLMAGRHINVQKASKDAGRMNRDKGIGGNGISGLKGLGMREMSYRMAFVACTVETSHDKYGHFFDDKNVDDPARSARIAQLLTEEERQEMLDIIDSPTNYSDLISSICPSVYGHKRIKEGILLLLLGGVHKVTPEGTNSLRGDINVCIVGDPGLSKSQFLKYVSGLLPRGIYTSGKASTAAGLTASVVKDEETGDFVIEAGALMLADNGICCIDEFDKMDLRDQVAIHEAMEQQTISIAKAGIHATLNARTSILAAANPINGRYDKTKSLIHNINMSAPIMSRFDLFFVVMDRVNENEDYRLAKHILNVHRDLDSAVHPKYSTDLLRRFILFAKALRPKLTTDAGKALVEMYQNLRQSDSRALGRNGYRITVRQLESLIRLSEAMARANADSDVNDNYVRAAAQLLKNSIVQAVKDDIDIEEDETKKEEPTEGEMATDGVAAEKTKFRIGYDEFVQIRQWVISLLQKLERQAENEASQQQHSGEEEVDDGVMGGQSSGVKFSKICEEYLASMEGEMETEQDYEIAYRKIHGVLKNLIRNETCLLPINAKMNDEGLPLIEDETILVVHPSVYLDL